MKDLVGHVQKLRFYSKHVGEMLKSVGQRRDMHFSKRSLFVTNEPMGGGGIETRGPLAGCRRSWWPGPGYGRRRRSETDRCGIYLEGRTVSTCAGLGG